MGSFKGNGRGDGPKRRPDDVRRRRQGLLQMETLEERRLLATTASAALGGAPNWHPTTTNLFDGQNGPLANLGKDTVKVYAEYLSFEATHPSTKFVSSLSNRVYFSADGNSVGIDVRGYGDFNTYKNALTSLGMVITAAQPKFDYIEGYVPIAKLPAIAQQAQTIGGAMIYKPITFQQGIGNNQADLALNTAGVRTTYNVDGTGQKIGVLSDSVSLVGGGLATSVASKDLPANVQVLQEGPTGGADEGRAMLEQIYDIAPGASLAFASAFNGPVSFANNITALFNAGAGTIVDDVSYANEPFFQDGIIQQAVNGVVASGATYLSSAGNEADSGYESQFRAVSTTVGTLGAGTYMNFDPTGATVSPMLGINVYGAGALQFQFDQPYFTSNGVTSNVEIIVLDAAGNIVQQANNNNVASQMPEQFTGNLAPGLYNVVIKVDSGPNPGHVVFREFGTGGFSVDHKFGSAGGTFYPSTGGHNAGATTISVGAVPFWATPAYVHTPALNTNEPFSSFGPVLTVFNPDGSALASPALLLKPDISATDANNTSFFSAGSIFDTTQSIPANPPFPGSPVTTFPTPTTPTNQLQNLPNFFGTSSAAPNLAALVALMKQSNPTLTRNQIVTNLTTTATSLNGVPGGTWSPQAGFGLANGPAALAAAQVLKVLKILPGGNRTLSTVPQFITVLFSQPVNLATVSSSNLIVTGPNGANVTVGQPIGVDSSTFPTTVQFPITITPAAGQRATGVYVEKFVPGNIVSQSGVPLTGTVTDQFNLQVVNGPVVTSTSFIGRIVNVQFNEAVNPGSISNTTVMLFRNGGVNNPRFGPGTVIVNQLPGAITTYNPNTFTVTIDLSGVPQSSLPTDRYALTVTTNVTDSLNNPLNGLFSGVFPSGTNPSAPNGTNFLQDLGVVQVTAPFVSSITLAASSDTGIKGDLNTRINTPSITGQVTARFPATVANILVYAEFNGIVHPGIAAGGLDLGVGAGGRGFVGRFDVQTTTDALGRFTIVYPAGVSPLPEGQNRVRVLVVGQPDQPPFAGYSSSQDLAFRVDGTLPYIGSVAGGPPTASIPANANINSLTSLTLNVIDPVNPQTLGSPFAVDTKIAVPALDPTIAANIQNYRLLRVTGPNTVQDLSSFIASATFVSTSARVQTSDPYTGQLNLTFGPGLPAGSYRFLVLSSAYGQGLTDAAGNPFGGYASQAIPGTSQNYELDFNLQPTPTYITGYQAQTPNLNSPNGFDGSDVRASYELPIAGVTPRAAAPPTQFIIDFSNPLNPGTNYNNLVQLIRSADTAGGAPDGNFGDLGITNSSGFSTISGITVTLTNSVPGAVFGQYGYNNRLLVKLPPGLALPADYYRVYLPNTAGTTLTDAFGNQLDGEFLGYKNAFGKYVNQLQTGVVRGSGASELADLTGDGSAGGAFMTGFVVVPNGNIIYARADALYSPGLPSQTPNGSQALPYPVLAPEATFTSANGGDLNSPVNSGANFKATYDRSGDGNFQPSAFYAAQQRVQATGGPVVIIAQASIPSRDPATGALLQKPFVLAAPNPSGLQAATIANDATAAIPALTTLTFQAGSTLKMQNAALLVQNQGSALQILGGPNTYQAVTITSYKDSSIGGVSNGDPSTVPTPGDYGGILFRNFSQAALPGSPNARSSNFAGQIPVSGIPSIDNRLKGTFANANDPGSQRDAISGADDIMSYISFLTEKYAGGAVPATIGTRYDGITLQNSRPGIVNSIIANAGGAGSAEAGLSVNVDSLRADDAAQGVLIRNDQFINNGLNGIYIRAEIATGVAEATDAILYPTNPTSKGGAINYVLNSPYPYLLTSQLQIGQTLTQESGGALVDNLDRLNIIPGMLVKFELGAFLQIGTEVQGGSFSGQGTAASLNVGDPTYIKQYDANNNFGPTFSALLPNGQPNPRAGQIDPSFKANSTNLAKVLFTSFNDNAATTTYFDPISQTTTTIVAPLTTLPAGVASSAPAKGDWGGIQVNAGARAVINSAIFKNGGGFVNTPAGSKTLHALEISPFDNNGAFISITNNTFTSNVDVPINLTPDALLATDPTRPLSSGAPFIHGNVFTGNDFNGVGVLGGTSGFNTANLFVDSVWAGSDFTYILRNTIVLSGGVPVLPRNAATTLLPELRPQVTLTLQSTLPGTLLADGTTVAAPGVPLVIKLLNTPGLLPPAPSLGVTPPRAITNSYQQGAGFIVGVDNGIDPPADRLIDPGAFSQIRITGIGANQSTGQSRVPVIITSVHDSTVGTTVNGVQMNQVVPNDSQAPRAGDGGVIYFGGNSLTDYNLLDPRDGNIIDNADLKFLTRVEQQGGGITYGFGEGTTAYVPGFNQIFGLPIQEGFAAQYNAPKAMTVSNSNFANFSDVGFYAHPGNGPIVYNQDFTGPLFGRVSNPFDIPTHTFFVNNTFTGMPTGIEILSMNAADFNAPGPFPTPSMAVVPQQRLRE